MLGLLITLRNIKEWDASLVSLLNFVSDITLLIYALWFYRYKERRLCLRDNLLLSHLWFPIISFYDWLMKWSRQWNLSSIPLLPWRVMSPLCMCSLLLFRNILEKGEFSLVQACSLETLESFPLIGIVWLGLTLLLLHPFK